MPNFNDPATRVKINSETYIKFDGSEHLLMKNIHSEDGISIKYDIMLILYEMIDWKTVGELTAPWPPGDQEKIIQHLEMLHSRHVVITDESEAATVNESGLSEHLGKNIHINVENHHAMLRDYIRMAAYRRAIEHAVKADTIALDLGCGSGILSFFTATAGANKVYAIERRPDIILLAEELAKANGLDGKIEFIEGSSSHINENRLTPKPDLLVAEILGNGILEENVLEYTIDARRRFLTPGAAMIPCKLDIYFFAFDSGFNQSRWQEVEELKDLYGYDFSLMGQVLCNKATTRMDRYNTMVNKTMSDPVMVKSLDFRTLEDAVFANRFEMEALEDGQITSFCGYFKAHLDEETILTNSPWAPATHWTQLVYTLAAPRPVKKGEKIAMEVIYDGALRVQLAD
ncbi:MAG TPA: 50S ribosomal protein L11 methyltransferase [Coleofasciculaceae cyanobacterium]|jgi:SAM-dependent methyltransferase